MRVLAILGAWLCLSTGLCKADVEIHDQLTLLGPSVEPAPSFDLSPALELPQLDTPEVPLGLRETLPPHLVMVGRVRGAMLDRCRPRMRSVLLIGHGASTDGRPDTCRLLSFVGVTKFRERAIGRRAGVRNRFAPLTIEDMPEMPHAVSAPVVVSTGRTLDVPRASRGRQPPPPLVPLRPAW